ncbi:MAG: ATP synthase F1 subunit epsilon [Dehalococcoidia bacterium]|nr:ATP synthase F1 subunit epsilon [Dehalococcoidia bacterium]
MPLRLSIVTQDRTVLEQDDVTRLVVPTTEGQITILPSHAPLMASLSIGEMVVYTPAGPDPIAVHGGFIQVVDDEVSVLADAAERASDIDETRADEARTRAERHLTERAADTGEAIDLLRAQAALQRSLLRLRVVRRRRGTGVPASR